MNDCRVILFSMFLSQAISNTCFAAGPADSVNLSSRRRINIIVSSRMTIPDGAPISFQLQAIWQQIFHKKQMFVIIVGSLNEFTDKVSHILDKENAMIGNLWFDSHGHMGRRISLFELGKDEINYQIIREPYIQAAFIKIGSYCDSNTNISIGSCYSAATFTLPEVEIFPAQRMNGDSLMISVSELMNKATVFGSEGWVMTGPGIFNSGYALAGKPNKKRYKDPLFLPVWKKLGQWQSYSAKDGIFKRVQTLSMDETGNINPNYMSYLAFDKNQKKQMKIINRLKKGNYKVSYFYKYEFPTHDNLHHLAKNQ